MLKRKSDMMPHNDTANQISDVAIASITARWGMGGGVATSIFGWLSTNQAAVLIGIIITVLGFVVNAIFQWKREARARANFKIHKQMLLEENKRKEEIHALTVTKLKQEIDDGNHS